MCNTRYSSAEYVFTNSRANSRKKYTNYYSIISVRNMYLEKLLSKYYITV